MIYNRIYSGTLIEKELRKPSHYIIKPYINMNKIHYLFMDTFGWDIEHNTKYRLLSLLSQIPCRSYNVVLVGVKCFNQAMRLLKKSQKFFCYKCQNGYRYRADWIYHIFQKHDGSNYCFRCNSVFFVPNMYKRHIRKWHGVNHWCIFCPEAYEGLMYRRNYDKTQYQCFYCHKAFCTPKKLYNHLCIHEKPFKCSLCLA